MKSKDPFRRLLMSLPVCTQRLLVLLFGTFRVMASNADKAGTNPGIQTSFTHRWRVVLDVLVYVCYIASFSFCKQLCSCYSNFQIKLSAINARFTLAGMMLERQDNRRYSATIQPKIISLILPITCECAAQARTLSYNDATRRWVFSALCYHSIFLFHLLFTAVNERLA